MNVRKLAAIVAVPLLAFALTVRADITSDLQAQVQALQRQLDAVKAQLDAVTAEMQKQKQAQEQQVRQAATGPYIERKPGDALTFLVPGGGEVTLYGNLDLSLDWECVGPILCDLMSISSGSWKRALIFPQPPEPSSRPRTSATASPAPYFHGTASLASPARNGAPS